MRQHIAIYIPSLRGGGAERVATALANGFAKNGHEVDLVLAKAEGPYLQDVAENVRIVDLDVNRVLRSLGPLVRYLRRERPQALLSFLNHANMIAVLARKLAGIPVRLAVSERNAPSATLVGGGKVAVMRTLSRLLLPKADIVIGVSKAMGDELNAILKIPREKIDYVYNPVDLDGIRSRMTAPIDLGKTIDSSQPLIVAVGRLTRQKDYPTLLKAFSILLERRSANLAILGQGEDEAALKILAQELGIGHRVLFPGFQANPHAWIHASDLYVMSSRWEGLPNALLEALACAPRLVSTDCRTGPREILEDGKWGRLVPVGDAQALATAMDAALDEPKRRDLVERAAAYHPERTLEGYARLMNIEIERPLGTDS